MTMKKILLSFLALGGLLFASSCQMDEPDAGTLTGEVDFSITAGIPSGITTYSPTDGDAFSHLGGINNVTSDYVLRFILEVYDGDAVAYTETKYLEDFSSPEVTFNPRLLAKEYDFVFWPISWKKGILKKIGVTFTIIPQTVLLPLVIKTTLPDPSLPQTWWMPIMQKRMSI